MSISETSMIEVAELLNIEKVKTPMQYVEAIESGFPVTVVSRLAEKIAPQDKKFTFRLVPQATLARRRKTKKLSVDESERISRLAELWQLAIEVWGEEDDARAFLRRAHPLLEGKAPLSVALGSEPGARLVEEVILRLKHGSAV